jgi:Novel STAND NTPase 3/Restriction endonuclease
MGEFDALSPPEFEDFTSDLLSAVEGVRFTAGPPGRDGKVDGLYVDEEGRRHVIQCKHFIRSDFSELKKEARKEAHDLAKLEKNFASYHFVTSMELTHDQRDQLFEILEPWVETREKVLGGKELRARMGEEPGAAVATHHPKLWFSGAAQLRRQLSAQQYERRGVLLEEIRPRLPRYVETRAFRDAQERLCKNRTIVIDGPPGVGKTTLAQLLLIESLEEGYEPFEVTRGALEKAWELLDLDERQIFYFDDFLGHIMLSESRDEDHELVKFAHRVASDARRRFILTTRDYIFTEARRRSAELYREIDDAYIFFLTPEAYTRLERARIFYNHVYFSHDLDAEAKDRLVLRGHHLEVVDHPNYTPRLIEWVTGFSGHRLREREKEDFGRFCLDVLDSPDDLWDAPFEELDEHREALLLAFLGLPDQVKVEHLALAFERACASRGIDTGEAQFEHALRGLEGSFIRPTSTLEVELAPPPKDGERAGPAVYSLQNPSLLDFLDRRLLTSRADTEAVLRVAFFFEQVEWLWNAWRKKEVAPPEHLWPAFDEAFARSIASPTTVPPWSYTAEGPEDNFHEELGKRLRTALDWCLAEPRLLALFEEWLRDAGWEWLNGLGGDGKWIPPQRFELFEALLDSGVLDEVEAGNEMQRRLRVLAPSLNRWELLDLLRERCPEALPEREIVAETAAFREYAQAQFDDPVGFYESEGFYGTEGLEQLLEIARAWDVELDPGELDWMRGALLDIKARDDEENDAIEEGERLDALAAEEHAAFEAARDETDPDEKAEAAEIEAMFWRLVSERWRDDESAQVSSDDG